MPELREYQTNVIARVERVISEGTRKVLIVAPTGSGKTVVAAEIIRRFTDQKKSVLVLAHRRELIRQTSEKLYAAGVQDHGIIQAGFPGRPDVPVQIASIQTLHARAIRSRVIDMPEAGLVLVDEAHHVRARTYEEILNEFPDAIIIGMTATPCRRDGRGLGRVFDIIIESEDVRGLTEKGFLVPAIVFAPAIPDLKGVKVQNGDYIEREIAERMDKVPLIGDAITHWMRHAKDRRTVAFCSGVAHSLHVCEEFNRAGIPAVHIDGTTPKEERDAALVNLARDRVKVITNDSVLTEGWDSPFASCAILLRPTKSLGLFRQMVGRVLRSAPGKSDAIILDHSGAVFDHGLPDDPIEWTLDGDMKAINRKNNARKKNGSSSRLKTCPKCSALRLGGEGCKVCGWKPAQRPEGVDIRDGDLARVGEVGGMSKQERDRWHRELAFIGQEKGFKPGWVSFKYKEKFGEWPKWGYRPVPLPPSPEVLAWVRSRFIAYDRAKRKAQQTNGLPKAW